MNILFSWKRLKDKKGLSFHGEQFYSWVYHKAILSFEEIQTDI